VDSRIEDIFVGEVATQCGFIVAAAEAVNEALRNPTAGRQLTIWRELQTIVISSANVSKLLWGSKGRYEAERSNLRKRLGVPDDSALRDPDLRNDFEHFDERILCWSTNPNVPGHYLGRNIGPRGSLIHFADGVTDADIPAFGHYDPDASTLSFWDHEVDLNALVRAAYEIGQTAQTVRDQWPPSQ
jgi:hypothetical protein